MTCAVDLPTPSRLCRRPDCASASSSSSGTSLIARAALRNACTLNVSAPLRSRRNAIWFSASSGFTVVLRLLFLWYVRFVGFLLGPARSHPGRLVGHLGVLRRPRRVLQPGLLVAFGHGEERFDRLGRGPDVRPGVA